VAFTAEQILEMLDADEPRYAAVAALVAGDGFEALTTLAQSPDPWTAARAASLLAELAGNPVLAPQALEALTLAADHPDAGVRAAAALGAGRAGTDGHDVLQKGLHDADPGVRLIALRGAVPPLESGLAASVNLAAAGDVALAVKELAQAIAARIPDASLANELIASVLDYLQARLAELRALALGNVASFAAAVEAPGFADIGGGVALRLTAARAALDLVPPRMAANDFTGAARQLGIALGEIAAAAASIGGLSFVDLLSRRVTWSAAVPAGLAKQLGLPATPPNLRLEGDTLVHALDAPARQLMAAPLLLRFDHLALTSRLSLNGADPALSVSLALTNIEAGVGGGPIASLLGGPGTVQADLTLGVDTGRGLTVGGGARVVLPARPKLGPLDVREITLEVPPGVRGAIDLGTTIKASIGGVIQATVAGSGLRIGIDPAAAAHGENPLSVALKPPTGIGLLVDAGLVQGGGFLGERSGGYGGALQLRLGPVELQAVGLLTLEPSFGLVVVMSISFMPPIDLTFGFTLNAVGGVLGIEHRLDGDALSAGVTSGALDNIMFPADPVAAAPTILDTLEAVFPMEQGSIVIGPMIEVGWGRPVSFLTAQVGVVLSLPDPLIVIIGRVRIALPAPQLPIVDLRATVYGELAPDHLLIKVSLNGSRIATFSVNGDMALLVRWSGGAEIAITAGGFHPRYDPPKGLGGLQRLSMDLSPPAVLSLRSEAYFAVTTNSVQLGSRTEMSADVGIADISGHFAFDALVLLSPHFSFTLDANAGLTVHVFGATLLGVQLQLHLSGPAPWHAQGSAEVEVLWASVSVDVGPFTWGDPDNPPPALADPRQLVRDALHHNPAAWQALVPAGADRAVRVKPATPSDVEVTIHPLGLFEVRQHVVPLETVVSRVGANPVPAGQQRINFGVPQINGAPAGALSSVTDLFAPGAYLDLSEDQKLSRPSFEPMMAGARMRPPGESAPFDGSREADLRYETFVCDDDDLVGVRSLGVRDVLCMSAPYASLRAGAAGRSELRSRGRYAAPAEPIVLAHGGEVELMSKATLAVQAGASFATYTHAAESRLPAGVQIARLGIV
jgi:hypothetical protein